MEKQTEGIGMDVKKVRYAFFTKLHHVEKLVNYLNQHTDIDYVITSERYEVDAFDFDVGVSYCFPWIIDIDAPEHKDKVFYNYHSAPLPEYKGLTVYADGVRNKTMEWGVSLHMMTQEVDGGPLLMFRRFPLHSIPVTTNELGCIGHYWLFQLFKDSVGVLQYKPRSMNEFAQAKNNSV